MTIPTMIKDVSSVPERKKREEDGIFYFIKDGICLPLFV
jgi:hypothetical protein